MSTRLQAFALTLACLGGGQLPPPRPPDLLTPEIRDDRTVTFRLLAPSAHHVVLWGDWMPHETTKDLARQGDGMWSTTVGPLPPGLYLYAFGVDGVRLADPANRWVKNGYPGLSSAFEVPGAETAYLSIANVPHGAIQMRDYYAGTLHRMRRVHVYTPPDFETSTTRTYPTLYLLHGSYDSDADWSSIGRAGIIVDNLIAQRKAVPMLIVMPDGHPFPSFERSTRAQNLTLLDAELIADLVPFAERVYRASPQPKDRAIAGCSMGGAQALHIGLQNLDRFAAIGLMSAPGDVPGGPPFAEAQAAILRAPAAINARLRLFWLTCGRDDPYLEGARDVSRALTKRGIEHMWTETEGGHAWIVWRQNLAAFASLLFRWS
jgi:enterochelin esterase family protein